MSSRPLAAATTPRALSLVAVLEAWALLVKARRLDIALAALATGLPVLVVEFGVLADLQVVVLVVEGLVHLVAAGTGWAVGRDCS